MNRSEPKIKTVYREFYHNEKIDFNNISNDTLIVFDTNVLLHIFRFSIESRKKLLDSINKVKDHIWIPYYVGLEYNLQKKSIIHEMKNKEKNINNKVTSLKEEFIKGVSQELNTIGITSKDENIIRSEVKKRLEEVVNKAISNWTLNSLNKEFSLIGQVEDKSEELASFFEGRIGKELSQKDIDEIETEGENRYLKQIPPGFKDHKKQDTTSYGGVTFQNKFTDLIIWKEILKQAKTTKIKKVVFISDDNKEDWVHHVDGYKKGVRAELKKELLTEANCDLFLINTNVFIQSVSGNKEDILAKDKSYISIANDIYPLKETIQNSDYLGYEKKHYGSLKSMPINLLYMRSQVEKLLTRIESKLLDYNEESLIKNSLMGAEFIELKKIRKGLRIIQKELNRFFHFNGYENIENLNFELSQYIDQILYFENRLDNLL